jgi:DNA-binding NarL/FixJ family response regulator
MQKIKIIIVDDHAILRHGICQSFRLEDDFEVIAEAAGGREAIRLASANPPDIMIMDVSMPGFNGIETTRQILAANSNIKTIALSMHAEKAYVMGMLNAGASGYILKSASFKELLACIKTVLSGGFFLCPKLRHLFTDKGVYPVTDNRDSIFSLLSNKEKKVLQFIAEGYESKAIAKKLYISIRTVEVHRLNLNKKLRTHNVAKQTKFAISQGITSLNGSLPQ